MILSFGLDFLDIGMGLVGGGLGLSMFTICSLVNAVLGCKSSLPSVPLSCCGCILWYLLFLLGAWWIHLSVTCFGAIHFCLVLQLAT